MSSKPPAEAAQLSFVAALAVGDVAAEHVPAGLVGFKWPNDVQLGGAKLSGILIESGVAPGGGLWLAIGVGINLSEAPSGLDYPATSIGEHLQTARPAPVPEAAASRLAATMALWTDVWDREGFAPIRQAWMARASGVGRRCTARLGDTAIAGVAEGLDVDGALLLRLDDGELRRISAGEIVFEGA